MSQTRVVVVCTLLLSGLVFSCSSAQEENSTDAKPKHSDHSGKPNRLARESSPYLLLHAHNPVDWYPWGPEAFEKAKKENKLIFLSVGYSSCYWCHVMERKVFSNVEIAKYMNEHFVNIKVDREERPDVDDIYMTSLMVYNQLTGSGRGGGWPLSMFLTPSGNPVAGATYLPPEDSPQTGPGFLSVATRLNGFWTDRRDDLLHTSDLIATQVQRMTKPGVELEKVSLDLALLTNAVEQVKAMYDPVWGGVDFKPERPHSPRFPNVPRLQMTLDAYERTGDAELLEIVRHSLVRMAHGGIRDHLAGGFHRYSTDRRWHVPHFEKMLYDQAMLLGIYARAAGAMDNGEFRQVAAEIADFIHQEMTTTEGGFCSALDAETNAIEGEYYVWSEDEVKKILGGDAEVLAEVYGMNETNPFEHGYVLHLPKPLSEVAKSRETTQKKLSSQLTGLRSKLLATRSLRERPLLDDKILTSWNALMIQALAISGRELNRPQDTAAAVRAAEFLLENLRDSEGKLMRTWRLGNAKYQAYLDDYAFLVAALLELHQTTSDARWLKHAHAVALEQNELFYDEKLQAFYFTATNHEKLIARTSSAYDSVFPAANSVSVGNLLRLADLVDDPELSTIAVNTLTRFAPTLRKSPAACSGLARALHLWLKKEKAEAAAQNVVPQTNYLSVSLPRSHSSLRDESQEDLVSPPVPDVIQQVTFRPVAATKPVSPFAKDGRVKPMKVKVYPLYNKLKRGGKCLVAIELQIQPGWHVNANPADPDFLVPTKVELKTKQKVKLTKVKYPKHHELKVEGFTEPYHVYDGRVMVYGLLEMETNQTVDIAELEFHVTFQGCNAKECLPPDKIVMKGKLPFAAPGETLKKVNESRFPKPDPASPKQTPPE